MIVVISVVGFHVDITTLLELACFSLLIRGRCRSNSTFFVDVVVKNELLYRFRKHRQSFVFGPSLILSKLNVLGVNYSPSILVEFGAGPVSDSCVGFNWDTTNSLSLVHMRNFFVVYQIGIICKAMSVPRTQHFEFLVADCNPGVSQDVFS